ncbi:AAA ATPase domain-containing protein [Fibrobacter sp. UWB16]|uniref:AAA family ATPase n=1 Tax=Fibrobacter sp. UWB16 TaxID=1945874 RepID=UPI000BDDB167|nr:AAA family ATPase [Fibrobacter sp. UWB16]SOD17885.1 AAA ATPase domain-containing protein [Fibrobacter sp. UWB16]
MKIEINGLYGRRNYSLELNDDVSIIMAENGSGKTTTLKFIESIFTGRLENLVDIPFDNIRIIDGRKRTEISRKEIVNPYYLLLSQLKKRDLQKYERVKKEIPSDNFLNLRSDEIFHYLRRLSFDYDVASSHYYRFLDGPTYNKKQLISVLDKANKLKRDNVIFFPTYRRVEQDLSVKLDKYEKEIHIAFGMKDVKEKFDRIERDLSTEALNLASSINKKLIVDAMSDKKPPKKFFESIGDLEDDIDLMLDRTQITTEKNKLIKLIYSKNFYESNAALAQIIYHLTEGFLELKKKDNKIKKFVEVVNKYLRRNKFVYDDRTVKIKCIDLESKDAIDLDYLSSGEKQIVGIFSFLYLSESSDYTIIIDEPEISLSTEWQEQLITDIMNSTSVKCLICATHSPYIIENEYINNVIPLESMRGC